MELHNDQKIVVRSPARFKIVRGGRRSGKTKLEVEDMSYEAASEGDSPIFYIAPTQAQARAIVWEELKSRLAGVGRPNESRLEMKVPARGGGFSIITVAGWENRENFRGKKAKKIYFDEVDTMKDFFIGWQEIFRPALTDYEGHAMFCGTPKKENPNLRRLEKMAETDPAYEAFHFTTAANPHISKTEIEKMKAELDATTYQQEVLAEYVDDAGALFHYDALVDVFSNTVVKIGQKYLIVDIADDGSDKTKFSFWEDLEEYRRETYERLNSEGIIGKIREYASQERIPYSHIAVDAIGVGAAVASSSLLDGIIGFKSSYAPIKTDKDIVHLPHEKKTRIAPLVSDYKNLRAQCIFKLSHVVNNHEIASKITGQLKENTIEELNTYQDASIGDGKRQATAKEKVHELIGRSPDDSDTWIMRMYFEIRNSMIVGQSPEMTRVREEQENRFLARKNSQSTNSTR